jgi:hypothetical protein
LLISSEYHYRAFTQAALRRLIPAMQDFDRAEALLHKEDPRIALLFANLHDSGFHQEFGPILRLHVDALFRQAAERESGPKDLAGAPRSTSRPRGKVPVFAFTPGTTETSAMK